MNYHNKVVIKNICYKFHIKSELFYYSTKHNSGNRIFTEP